MNTDPRPHIHRRGRAIDRLRTLTTGAAVAGLAGTAGFGVLAAATWSGNPAASPAAADGGTTTTTQNQAAPRTESDDDNGFFGNLAPTVQNPPTTSRQQTITVPRVQHVSGGGHATTGGSG